MELRKNDDTRGMHIPEYFYQLGWSKNTLQKNLFMLKSKSPPTPFFEVPKLKN